MQTADLDPDAVIRDFEQNYPGLQVWYGSFSRQFHALWDGVLFIARTPEELVRKLAGE